MKNSTPLHYATWLRFRVIVELLIKKGADINTKDIIYQIIIKFFLIKIIYNKWRKLNQKNETPLSYCDYKSTRMFQVLKKNQDMILKNSKNLTYPDNIYGILLKTGQYVNAKEKKQILRKMI